MLEAKTKLSKLVDAAEHGEEVLIARNGVPVAKIVPVSTPKLNLGFLKGRIGIINDSHFAAMTDEQAERFVNGGEW